MEIDKIIIGTAMNDTKPGNIVKIAYGGVYNRFINKINISSRTIRKGGFVYLEEVTSDGTKKVKLDDKRPYRNFIIRDGKS